MVLKRETIGRYVETIVERVRAERMPIRINGVVIFGSYVAEKKSREIWTSS